MKVYLDLLQTTRLLGVNPANTPMDPHHKITSKTYPSLTNPTNFRSIIGKLLYLTHTRLDINFCVCRLNRFLSKPTQAHFQAALLILRYIKSALGPRLFFKFDSSIIQSGFIDLDWGSCIDKNKLTTGFCFYMDNSLICGKSKKHGVVSCSSSEAEYRALANATCEAQWLLFLLHELGISHSQSVNIFCDNHSSFT